MCTVVTLAASGHTSIAMSLRCVLLLALATLKTLAATPHLDPSGLTLASVSTANAGPSFPESGAHQGNVTNTNALPGAVSS